MSTELHNRQDAPLELMPEAVGDMRAAIVTARFNSDITYALRDAALKTFKDAGIDDSDVDTFEVPGAVELTFAASQLIESGAYDVVIVFGCVIRGGHRTSTTYAKASLKALRCSIATAIFPSSSASSPPTIISKPQTAPAEALATKAPNVPSPPSRWSNSPATSAKNNTYAWLKNKNWQPS